MITNSSLVSIANLSREKILYLMEMAHEFELRPNRKLLDGRIVATLFSSPARAHAFRLRRPRTDSAHASSDLPTRK